MPRAPRLLFMTAVAVFVLAQALPARASTIVDTFDPTNVYMYTANGQQQLVSDCIGDNQAGTLNDTTDAPLTGCSSLLYYQDISPLPGNLTSATLTLTVFDDEICNNLSSNCQPQEAQIEVDLDTLGTTQYAIPNDGNAFNAVLTVTTYLLADSGNLRVLLSVGDLGGGDADFIFDKSVLSATFGDDVTPAPEPASLLLFGSGLSAVAFRLRRRKQSSRS